MKIKKKKPSSDSDSDDLPVSRPLRERKSKKVMSKHLADEIDAEAKTDGSVGLKTETEERSKQTWTKPHIREIDLERSLYRWYEGYKAQRMELSEAETILSADDLVGKAKNLMQRLGASPSLVNIITKSWILRWQERYGVPKAAETPPEIRLKSEEKVILEPIKQRLKKRRLRKNEEEEVSSSVKEQAVQDERANVSPDLQQVLTIDTGQPKEHLEEGQAYKQNDVKIVLSEYDSDQIYFAFCFEMNWKSLPDRTVEVKDDPIWLLMAANRSGRHRTRILVTGRHWRPGCLKHVNMLSQPVVYAGGGRGTLTPDLFAWWFRREFIPAAESFSSTAVLLVEDKWFSPKINEHPNRNVSIVRVSRAEAEDWDLILSEFKTKYATLLLRNMVSMSETTCENYVADYLTNFTLKDAFPLFHKTWLSVRSESFHRLIDIAENNSMECVSATSIQPALEGDSGLINLTKEEETGVKSESVDLTTGREERRAGGRLILTRRENVPPGYLQEDRMLLLELQWLAHDSGLEVTDEDLSSWVFEKDVKRTETVKTEEAGEESEPIPTAIEVVRYLSKALLWMESQPIDCNLLMMVRDVVDIAKQASKMGLAPPHPGAALPFFCHNGDHLTQPPPAHMGIPPYQLDAKGAGAMGEYWRGLGLGGLNIRPPASGPPGSPVPPHPAISPQDWKRLGPLLAASGLSRTPMYPFSAGSTYPYPMLSPEMSQVPASWHTPGMYPISAGAGFRSPYPTSLPISSTTLPSDFYRFSPTSLLPGHPGLSPHGHHSLSSHPAIVTPGPKQELGHHTQSDHNHRSSSLDHKNSSSSHHSSQDSKTQDSGSQNDKKKPHIKKPLNAFMLYMKEMRAKVVAECTLKESAAINQILGRRWHALGREEQAKYYELARRERQLHMQLYPDWSSRANSSRGKKRKRKQEANDGGNNMKKCRARYGLDQQSQWCKPCRRKKKCIRYLESGEERDGNQSEDNLGSCGSVGEAKTPPDDDDGAESLPHSLSSPGGLSGLSSLTSPSMILPSPSTSLASPSVSLASPCMSLQSPLTPPTFDMKPIMPIVLPPLNRNPVGTNPHDVNNPLSVNQLTGKCIKSEPKEQSRPISVT